MIEGALSGARAAYQLIDMTKHKGEHKRLGAMDVCPFIPVAGVTMDDCVRCAHEFGRRVALELNIPIFMYGYASKQDYRFGKFIEFLFMIFKCFHMQKRGTTNSCRRV